MAGGSAHAHVLPYKNIIIMTKFDAERIVCFFGFLVGFRVNPLFSWEVRDYVSEMDAYEIVVHVLDPIYSHEIMDIISGISGVTFFEWSCMSSNSYAMDIFIK